MSAVTDEFCRLNDDWKDFLQEEFSKEYFHKLIEFVEGERKSHSAIFPPKPLVFNAFNQTPLKDLKVVIMGQDPYHGAGQAHGLSFSVTEGVPPPPSLQNIYKELASDVEAELSDRKHGCLLSWAHQGVLLLNATLTVRASTPKSHYGMGWETFTDSVIKKLCDRDEPLIFVLWGKSAKEKCSHLLTGDKHLVLTAAHPSPFSAHSGFFGCKHFSKINEKLASWGKKPIDWSVR